MNRSLFLIILMGQCNSSTCQPRRLYHFVDQRKSWSDAQSYCRALYTDLATINDMEDVELLHDCVDGVDNEAAWIGLEKRRLWHWPDGAELNEAEAQWGDGEPNNLGGKENCVVMKRVSGTWVDVTCNKEYNFICENVHVQPSGSNIPHETEFRLIEEKRNWKYAQSYCQEHHNGHLASPKNKTENSKIKGMLANYKFAIALIGLTVARDPWEWSDGSNATFKHWQTNFKEHSGQNRNCAVTHLTDGGKWNARDCTEELPFFCYSVPRGCLDGWLNFNGSCYRRFADKHSWSAAEQHCQDLNGHLVSINSQDEQAFVEQHLVKSPDDHWIGLNYTEDGQFKWTDGRSLVFLNWAENQPDRNDCVMIRKGEWHDFSCDTEQPFICKSGSDNLILIKRNMSWFDAVYYCREKHHDLVSVHNAFEQDWVRQRAKMADTSHVWLGMHYSCPLGFWFWLSNQDSCYRNWAPGNGTGSCGMATAVERGGNQSWVSLDHDMKFNFICAIK